MLVKSGQIKKIETQENNILSEPTDTSLNKTTYFKTQSGIKFKEQELMQVDPNECIPWAYANRLSDEMGNMDELIESIKENQQLQPALVRPILANNNDGIRYEIIFGRRRHKACQQLGIPFLVIVKDIQDPQDAVAYQDAENKSRKNVSNYSNAILYKKLLEDKIFLTEKDLAKKLGIAPSSLNELMTYVKIPEAIISRIPDIHSLSISMAIKIVSLVNKSPHYLQALTSLASHIGVTITSPSKLENAVKSQEMNVISHIIYPTKIIKNSNGIRLFTFKVNHKGVPCIQLNIPKHGTLDYDELCDYLKTYLEAI
jgi:ParB family chromosome partitioning protein